MELNRNFLLLALFFIIFISGCIKIDVSQQINGDGSSSIQVIYDLSTIFNTTFSIFGNFTNSSSSGNFTNTSSQICSTFYNNTSWQNPNCMVTQDYKIIFSGTISLVNDSSFNVSNSIPYSNFKFDARDLLNILAKSSKGQSQNFTDAGLSGLKILPGSEFSYSLQMPGSITSAEIGKIYGNTVVINVFDLIGKQHDYIESQDVNYLWDSALFGTLGIVAVFIARRFVGV